MLRPAQFGYDFLECAASLYIIRALHGEPSCEPWVPVNRSSYGDMVLI